MPQNQQRFQDMPINDVLVTEIFPPEQGGSGRWFKEIYSRAESDVVVITHQPDASKPIPDDEPFIRRTNLKFKETGFFTPLGILGYLTRLWRVRKTIGSVSPTVIRAGRVLPEGWLVWLNYKFFGGSEYHVFVHGEEINLEGKEFGGVMSSRQHRIMAGIVFREAKKIICNSKNSATLVADQWKTPRNKITIANPGVDAAFFQPFEGNTELARRQSKITLPWLNRFVVLTVGRLQKRKGQDHVLRAIAELIHEIPNILYVIVGDGEEETRLKSISRELKIEQYVEFKSGLKDGELKSCYQLCDLFVLANRQVGSDIEGFGMVLLEAASCGKATIAGCSGGTSEAVDKDITGLVIDAGDVSKIRDAIAHLANNDQKRSEMGQKGRKRVVEKFDWPVVLKQLTKN